MRRLIIAALSLVSLAVPAAAQSTADFQWSGAVPRGKTLEIKGVNGAIRAELTTGDLVEVRASKRGRHDDPGSVSIERVEEAGSVTLCAVYPSRTSSWRSGRHQRDESDERVNECRVGETGHIGSHDNDVVVDFVVRVPAGVRFVGKTVNGTVDARGLKSDADLRTVNGRIDLSTTGVGSAETVNGSIDATIGSANWSGRLEFSTVNGSIVLRMPKDLSTNLRTETMSGHFDSDFPVSVESFRGRNRRIVGVIGRGGRDLDVATVNGRISLRFVPD